MTKHLFKIVAVACAAVAFSAPSAAITIGFEDLAAGPQSNNFVSYPDATFTGEGEFFVGTLDSKNICARLPEEGCTGTFTVDFTRPVNNLTFDIGGDGSFDNGDIDIFIDGLFATTVDLIGNELNDRNLQDLTGFSRITRLVIRHTDDLGVDFDNFSFDVAPVPEPGLLGLLGLGVLGIAAARRRKAA